MSQSTGDIKRRIRSIGGTRKITKAMELVSSVKMRKATSAAIANRPYADRAWDLLLNLASRTDPARHPLLRRTDPAKSVAVIVISSNRGFVGGLNSQLVAMVERSLTQLTTAGVQPALMFVGSKGRVLATGPNRSVAADFLKDDVVVSEAQIRPVARLVIDGFRARRYDRVVVAFADYVSPLVQKPRLKQILPLVSLPGEHQHYQPNAADVKREFVFEPNPDAVLESLVPHLVEMQIYRAMLESNASEHAARMMAMRNASDSAGELIDDLTLTMNQVRQAAITQDLSEISASRAALEA